MPRFEQLGLGFTVLEPAETMGMYDADVGYARFPERVNHGLPRRLAS